LETWVAPWVVEVHSAPKSAIIAVTLQKEMGAKVLHVQECQSINRRAFGRGMQKMATCLTDSPLCCDLGDFAQAVQDGGAFFTV